MYNYSTKILAVIFLLLPIAASAVTVAPGIPHQFYGTISFSTGATPDGLTVEAKIDNIVIGSSVTKDGKYGYNPNLLFATDPDSARAGQTIHFFVSGIDTGQTIVFANGEYTNLNLIVPGTVGTITKSADDVITNQEITITSTTPTVIKMGESLNVTVSSTANTNANIEKIEKMSSGNVAILSGKNFLNSYDIKISGENLTISVTMKYDDSGIDENTISPYLFNGTSWVAITPFTIDKTANTITFTISAGQTVYGVFGSAQVAQSSSSSSGGGGGSYTPPVTATSTLSAEAQKVDANKDNKIDVLDFNTLMVNWGKTTANNVADFNSDGKVDIFDFNLLMINWTK